MRKIVMQEMVSLDGFAAGPNGEFDWPLADEEFEKHVSDLLDAADSFLLGRRTYEMLASYWPTALPSATGRMKGSTGAEFAVPTRPTNAHEAVARRMNSYCKIVFSRSLDKVEWANSIIVREVDPEEMIGMKNQPGRNMVVVGSIGLAHSLMGHDLIDEYRIWVNPILLGKGKPLFGSHVRTKLELLGTKTFRSGLVELHLERRR